MLTFVPYSVHFAPLAHPVHIVLFLLVSLLLSLILLSLVSMGDRSATPLKYFKTMFLSVLVGVFIFIVFMLMVGHRLTFSDSSNSVNWYDLMMGSSGYTPTIAACVAFTLLVSLMIVFVGHMAYRGEKTSPKYLITDVVVIVLMMLIWAPFSSTYGSDRTVTSAQEGTKLATASAAFNAAGDSCEEGESIRDRLDEIIDDPHGCVRQGTLEATNDVIVHKHPSDSPAHWRYVSTGFSEVTTMPVVSPKIAWVNGADKWDSSEWVQFRYDPDEIVPVSAGALHKIEGLDTFSKLSEEADLSCDFVNRYERVIKKYDFSLPEVDALALSQSLNECQES